MAVLNVTPDSFSDGGLFLDVDRAIGQGLSLVEAGADVVDIGGESSRPGAEPVSLVDELARVIPVIEGIRRVSEVPISIDTTKAEVARRALHAGADIINDISAGTMDQSMFKVAAESECGLVLMHMRGRPQTMQQGDLSSDDIVSEVCGYLETRLASAVASGILRERVCLDPGIGFGKTVAQNVELHVRISELQALQLPVLMGTSRKSFIGHLTERAAENRLYGTAASVAVSAWLGAHFVRVHDVAEMRDVVAVADALRNASQGVA